MNGDSGCGWLILVVLVVVVGGIWINPGCFSHVRDVDYNLSASQLRGAYENNAIAAHSKYKGKIVTVSGYVKEVGLEKSTPYITFQEGDGLFCRFYTPDNVISLLFGRDALKYSNRNLESLSKWDRVVVKGFVDHEVVERVVSIKNCIIIKNSAKGGK